MQTISKAKKNSLFFPTRPTDDDRGSECPDYHLDDDKKYNDDNAEFNDYVNDSRTAPTQSQIPK